MYSLKTILPIKPIIISNDCRARKSAYLTVHETTNHCNSFFRTYAAESLLPWPELTKVARPCVVQAAANSQMETVVTTTVVAAEEPWHHHWTGFADWQHLECRRS